MMASKYLRALISIAILAQTSAALSADTQPGQQSDPASNRAGRLEDDLKLEVVDAQVFYDLYDNPPRPAIEARLSGKSARDFGRFTRDHVDQIAELLLDANIIDAPVIRSPIRGGQIVLFGNFDVDQATRIAKQLRAHEVQLSVRVKRAL
jgi:preprotein translocase subunit SecD